MSELLIDSDNPMDKIIWLEEGEMKLDEFGGGTKTIAHNLGAVPFVKGVWSVDGFKTALTFGTQRQQEQFVSDKGDVYSNGKEIKIRIISTPRATIQYHLWAFVNESETQFVNFKPTSQKGTDRFVFNSDYNYPQLIVEGYLNKGQEITFPLDESINEAGIPFVEAWAETPDGWTNHSYEQMWNIQLEVGKTKVRLNNGLVNRVYVRVYK